MSRYRPGMPDKTVSDSLRRGVPLPTRQGVRTHHGGVIAEGAFGGVYDQRVRHRLAGPRRASALTIKIMGRISWPAGLAITVTAITLAIGAAFAAAPAARATASQPRGVDTSYLGTPLLNSIAAVSPSDVWAAGSADGKAVIVHWNGAKWS